MRKSEIVKKITLSGGSFRGVSPKILRGVLFGGGVSFWIFAKRQGGHILGERLFFGGVKTNRGQADPPRGPTHKNPPIEEIQNAANAIPSPNGWRSRGRQHATPTLEAARLFIRLDRSALLSANLTSSGNTGCSWVLAACRPECPRLAWEQENSISDQPIS